MNKDECAACQSDAVAVEEGQLRAWLTANPEWQCVSFGDYQALVKPFDFSSFVQAFAAAGKIAALAEQYHHHPELRVSWGRLEVHWWSHKIRAIHPLDLLLAEKSDALLAGQEVQA